MHYDFPELEIKGKDIAFGVIIVLVLFGVCFYAGNCVGWERCEDVHGDGSGTQPISTELGNAGTNISNAEAGIGQAENHAGNIEAGIGNAQESADYLQGTVSTSEDIIKQCKSIIERVRQRGKKETP